MSTADEAAPHSAPPKARQTNPKGWRGIFGSSKPPVESSRTSVDEYDVGKTPPARWSLGILNDKRTEEVPGSILLLESSNRNEPLGLQNQPARTSVSSLPSPYLTSSRPESLKSIKATKSTPRELKKTKDGQVVLDPQPEESPNDPLNWPALRRDAALLSLGFYCMVGGGMTPILAAGFNNVASTFHVTTQQVAFTTGLYMLGLGIGSVIASPTAILFGKRPIYLIGSVLFILSSVWCALAPNYGNLVVARIFQGIAVSPVECLPSATIAEIFFLHERAYRVGVYTLLLLGGKNLVPLVSAAIIQSLGWRWVFWIVAIVVGFGGVLLFFFVPETFWDRTPRAKKRPSLHAHRTLSSLFHHAKSNAHGALPDEKDDTMEANGAPRHKETRHVGFAEDNNEHEKSEDLGEREETMLSAPRQQRMAEHPQPPTRAALPPIDVSHDVGEAQIPSQIITPTESHHGGPDADLELAMARTLSPDANDLGFTPKPAQRYTTHLRSRPPKTFKETLRPWNGRLNHANWFKVMLRPFILFLYPSVLWSAMVYSLSVGWLIVLSESVAHIYRDKDTYNFSALGTGLIYMSPFIGGVLGTAVAGKVSDIIVRFMSRRNGGIYEPEFRLVMGLPVALSTATGLMGFGWSAQEKDKWIVPTVFFGIISFGCSLGSTTAITFCVDSYRQYAGEALVTLNFSKNVFHGLVFSLFFVDWLEADGAKDVFLIIGGIQLACLTATIPMYIYGKRARMWTVRRNMMEKF